MFRNVDKQPTAASHPISAWIHGYSRRQQFRRLARSLLRENDDTLSDLGYSRVDLEGAMHLPIRNDAMQFLESRRMQRAREARRRTMKGNDR